MSFQFPVSSFQFRKSKIHWAWIVLAVCFVNLFINYSARLGYGVILPEMIRTLEFGRTAAGSIFNAYLFTYIAITPFTGYFTDRFGGRRVITICAFILGLGLLLMGTVDSLWTACLFYAVVGIGASGMWTPLITVVQRWFSHKRRGMVLGILSTGFGLGFAAMGGAFPWVVEHYNWRYAWSFLGSAALIMVFINGLLLRSDPESSGYQPWGQKKEAQNPIHTKDPIRSSGALPKIFRNRTFWLIGLSYFAIAYALYGITTFMVDYARYQLHVPLEKASFLATIHGLCQVAGMLIVLPLSDYWGRKKTILFSNAMITVALIGILLTGNSWNSLSILIGCLAIFYGATFPIYGACAGDYFPKEVMGTVLGAWTPFYGLGAIATHWITGALRDSTGVYDHSFLINAAMGAMGLAFMAFVKNSKES
ncbi:MAG TPA: MFS transporter [Deltaproteobacteria bacterium]|nr:MFS transporter [Deltaproteobacteria bacterium]